MTERREPGNEVELEDTTKKEDLRLPARVEAGCLYTLKKQFQNNL